VTKNSIQLSWRKPEFDGGSRINSYVIEMLDKESGKFRTCAKVKGSVFRHTITGLKEGAEYELRVRAVNEAGPGEARDAFSSVITKDEQGELRFVNI